MASLTMDMSLSKLKEIAKDREARRAAFHGEAKVRHNLTTEPQPCYKSQKFPNGAFMTYSVVLPPG